MGNTQQKPIEITENKIKEDPKSDAINKFYVELDKNPEYKKKFYDFFGHKAYYERIDFRKFNKEKERNAFLETLKDDSDSYTFFVHNFDDLNANLFIDGKKKRKSLKKKKKSKKS